ncbi:MAG: FG-GAP-like repeat-containing protein, partial [Polyangia bacterium]
DTDADTDTDTDADTDADTDTDTDADTDADTDTDTDADTDTETYTDWDSDGLSNDEELSYGDDCALSDPFLEDGDEDGIVDGEDPYPLDPFAEFVVRANNQGSFFFYLSNRDGTFMDPIEWGDDIGDNYRVFSIADFDDDGKMDFIGHSATADGNDEFDMYFFYRPLREDEFEQIYVGKTSKRAGGVVADINGDFLFDVVSWSVEKPNYIASVTGYTFINNGTILTAPCAVSDWPDDSCAFTRRQAFYMGDGSAVDGEWGFRLARQAMDFTGDGVKDLVMATYASGAASSAPLYRLDGNGDGTFEAPVDLFTHQYPVNSAVFADFDGDDVGDVVLGLDDDGDPGQAWIYYGTGTGTFETTAHEAFDIEPGIESGSDQPGTTSSARAFDFDFDGNMDIMVGHNYESAWSGPSRFDVYLGGGDGSFSGPFNVETEIPSTLGNAFEIPQKLCPLYE